MVDIVIAVGLILLVGVVVYQIKVDWYTRSKTFEVQIEMAQAQQLMVKDLSWEELKKIINDVISFTVSSYIITNNLRRMNDQELSVMWTVILRDLCTNVEISLGEDIKRQAFKIITKDYFTQFIKNSVEIVIVYQLENNKENRYNDKLATIQKNVMSQMKENTKK